MSEIQLFDKFRVFRSLRVETPSILEIKLWFRSIFLRFTHNSMPSITLISLNDRIRVTNFVKPFRFCINLMLLLNRFRYFMYSRLTSLAQFLTTKLVISSTLGLVGITGGILFSIAVLFDLPSSSGNLKLFSINSETWHDFRYLTNKLFMLLISHLSMSSAEMWNPVPLMPSLTCGLRYVF